MTRSLLLKGLAGVAALGGTVGGLAVYGKEIFGGGRGAAAEEIKEDLSGFSQKDLIDKVGLNCGLTENELTESETKDCSVKENGTINVKRGKEEKEEGVSYSSSSGTAKLKVSKSEGYSNNLKFVVDSGDLDLTKGEASPTIRKLEQFETYEVEKVGSKFYLSRKTDAKEEKIKALGLPSGCSLPESGDSNCSLTTEGEIKKVNFEKQNGEQVSLTSGSVTLKITKMTDSDSDFGDEKYRFTFTFPGDQTINTKKIKANTPYDFKIKKGTGNSLTLEKAWSEDKEFAKKAGLDCNNNTQCSISSGSKLNVKVGDQKKTDISNIDTSSGKIKMETEQAGYNQGLKFTITSGDVSISDGTGDGISKLEELETYEITEEGGKYYLTRKTTKEESIRSSLSIPESCFTTLGTSCTLSADAFKAINFEGKSNASASGNITLKISKVTNTTDFPLGYRFTFSSDKEETIETNNKIKANIPTDFKIKKNDSNPASISLEKAWSDTNFAAKVGLDCSSSDGCCTKSGTQNINVKRGNETKTGITSFGTSSSGKIKVEKDQAGYNQGLKFTISGGSVTLTGGNGGTFTQLDEYETYEITEEGDKYYLTRKTEVSETIETQLGLKEAGCSLSSSTSCTLTSDKLQKINFDDKGNPSISSGNATLTISKATNTTDFPLGYKFTLQSTSGNITIKDNSNVVKQNIPTEFKIKKPTGTGSLSLEKAWTADSLGKKVGLSCTSETECSINGTGGSNLRVKQLNKHDNEAKSGNLSKATNSNSDCSTSGKIKVTKDQAGYNQGFKFKIEDGNIKLSGSAGSDDSNKIHRLGEFETYEIKEEGKEWYLVRKERADKFIKDQLKLKDVGCSESENFPHSSGDTSTYCRSIDANKLEKINFEGKNGHSWPTGSVDVELEIKHDSSLPGGFKFVFTNNDSVNDVCLPAGTNGQKVNLQKNSSSGVEYKIKRTGTGDSVTLTLEKKDNGGGSCSS